MPAGTLEVLLVGAKGLENTDFLCNMDPYAILICRTQEQKSSVASGKGTEPEWNENFVFTVSEGVSEMTIKLMDSDNFSSDDFVGEATIPLEPLFMQGSIPPTVYNVVKDQEYCGEIRVGLTFTPEERGEQRYGTGEQRYGTDEQRYGTGEQRYGTGEQRYGTDEHGGWKESS
ncbi:elicitor-responsive protein 3 isoform X2 [Magnolia sinica]|uniref:elicitor-responsive protein 3 isoform X1 n=1 Tax=Magnolia sinica TaxID=86752 RepID=UPI00265812A4|nr:elicitor-responsive protein 3 isoform X1 [Magnolia sinica]XP_058078108.1 elicitor-responsive protein 3 isoform X2 [Magnolia sinica]